MPTDSLGKFRSSPHLMRNNIKAAPAPAAKSDPPKIPGSETNQGEQGGEQPATLHSNGDGSFRSNIGGMDTDHPTIGHAVAHMAGRMDPDSDHVVLSSDGMGGAMSNSVRGGGEVESNEHESCDEAGQHAAGCLGGEHGGGYKSGEPDGDELQVPMVGGRGMR
tara:strand:- start:2532 stop:3020 length:489 start_codon:yes stop_codon:yes gene_type:complete